jgi:hypothetical protein
MFIDADIHFDPEAVVRLVDSGHDVSVACYPKKVVMWEQAANAVKKGDDRDMSMLSSSLVINFGANLLPDREWIHRNPRRTHGIYGYQDGQHSRLWKRSFQTLWCKNDHQNRDFDDYHACFDCMIDPDNRRYLSEDYAFCRRWQQAGGKIYADVNTTLGHVGNLPFSGCLSTTGLRLSVYICDMKLVTILVTRSKSCHVKTLHTVLRLNVHCLMKNRWTIKLIMSMMIHVG